MNVIPASRRTDIPTFYMLWLMNRLQAYCRISMAMVIIWTLDKSCPTFPKDCGWYETS